jgi:hypothetical protein
MWGLIRLTGNGLIARGVRDADELIDQHRVLFVVPITENYGVFSVI